MVDVRDLAARTVLNARLTSRAVLGNERDAITLP
jgi:hypothetical protein